MIKIKNEAKYEIFKQQPLSLTLLLDIPEHFTSVKGLKSCIIENFESLKIPFAFCIGY